MQLRARCPPVRLSTGELIVAPVRVLVEDDHFLQFDLTVLSDRAPLLQDLRLNPNIGEVNERLGTSNSHLLLACYHYHPEGLSDGPGHQEQLLADFFRGDVLEEGNDEKDVAAEDDEEVEFVPATPLEVLLATLEAYSAQKVHAYRDVENELDSHEGRRLCDFESVDDGDDNEADTDHEEANVEVLALRRVVHVVQ